MILSLGDAAAFIQTLQLLALTFLTLILSTEALRQTQEPG